MRSPSVLIAGASARSAAVSAVRAGFAVDALDGYGDLDNPPGARVRALPRDFGVPFSAHEVVRVARTMACDAIAYLSPLENHPRAVAALAEGRRLLGNPPGVLRHVRDPFRLGSAWRAQGCSIPALRVARGTLPGVGGDGDDGWLLKPIGSGGGQGIRRWTAADGPHVPPGHYLQASVRGVPASVVFVSAGGQARILGLSRQLIGEAVFGATGFRYCGSILCDPADPLLPVVRGHLDAVARLVSVVTAAFDLVGVNGIDLIVGDDGAVVPVEVNPRWCASMELVERATGLSIFGLHAAACLDGTLPDGWPPAGTRQGAIGKAVVFASRDLRMGDTSRWLEDPDVRDVPHPGERISAGRPVCTVFARATDGAACHAALVERGRRVARRVGADGELWGRRP
jgi:uncharacterized protein